MREGIFHGGKEGRKFLNHTIQFFAKDRLAERKKQVFVHGKGNGLVCFAIGEKATGNAKLMV